jgi:predicted TIM-barrel fold metal-dependent hydrolase
LVVDFHVHLEYEAAGRKHDAAAIVAAMDGAGVDVSVLLGNDQADAGENPPWADPSRMTEDVNRADEEMAAYCGLYPTRFVGFTSVHPDRYQPHRKLRRAVQEFGMKGVKLYPHAGFFPNDPRLNRVFEQCIELDIPVMIHSGIKAVQWQRLKYNDPVFVDDVAVAFPELKIVLCHGGYPWTEQFLCVAYSNPNIWVDLTFLDSIERTYMVPDLVETTIRRLKGTIGTRRLLWGTEGPFMNLPLFGQHGPKYCRESQHSLVRRLPFLSEAEKDDILGNNAARLLKLGPSGKEAPSDGK